MNYLPEYISEMPKIHFSLGDIEFTKQVWSNTSIFIHILLQLTSKDNDDHLGCVLSVFKDFHFNYFKLHDTAIKNGENIEINVKEVIGKRRKMILNNCNLFMEGVTNKELEIAIRMNFRIYLIIV
jgi:hypothetical protein